MIESLTVAVPQNVIDRSHVYHKALADFERITGIKKTRRFEGTTLEMIKAALYEEQTTIFKDYIDNLIVVTQSPDLLSPCMAVSIHNYLGLRPDVPAFDLNHACDGYVLGLWLGSKLPGRTLLICADRLRYNGSATEGLIFSDAVSMTRLTYDVCNLESFTNGSDKNVDSLYCGLNGQMKMDGPAVFDFVTSAVSKFISECSYAKDCDLLVPHQGNLFMNKILEIRSGFKGRTLYSIEEYGNQSMNSIPTNLAHNAEKIAGKKLFLCGFGAGYTACGMGIQWGSKPITGIVKI